MRSETHGFAISGDLGFRMRASDQISVPRNLGDDGGNYEAKQLLAQVPRFSM
jgi:hypothetical protein